MAKRTFGDYLLRLRPRGVLIRLRLLSIYGSQRRGRPWRPSLSARAAQIPVSFGKPRGRLVSEQHPLHGLAPSDIGANLQTGVPVRAHNDSAEAAV